MTQYRVLTSKYSFNGRSFVLHSIEYSENGADWYDLFEDPSLEVCKAVSDFLSTQEFEAIRETQESMRTANLSRDFFDHMGADTKIVSHQPEVPTTSAGDIFGRVFTCASGAGFICGLLPVPLFVVFTCAALGGLWGFLTEGDRHDG